MCPKVIIWLEVSQARTIIFHTNRLITFMIITQMLHLQETSIVAHSTCRLEPTGRFQHTADWLSSTVDKLTSTE